MLLSLPLDGGGDVGAGAVRTRAAVILCATAAVILCTTAAVILCTPRPVRGGVTGQCAAAHLRDVMRPRGPMPSPAA
jgi:hypothetical protein